MKIKELFSDESKWTQGRYARDKDGIKTNIKNDNASCWCLVGAVFKCYIYHNADKAIQKLEKKFGKSKSYKNIVQWNDHPKRTFKQVKTLVNKLDI